MKSKTQIIKDLQRYKKIDSNPMFAEFLGIPYTTLMYWFKKDTFKEKIIQSKFPEVRPEFIRTGELPMLKEDEAFTYNHKGKGQPYYSVDFLGGFDVMENNNTVHPDGYINFHSISNVDVWVDITGKSMSPFISHGDIVGLTKLHKWDEYIQFGEIYGIVTEQQRTVKIVTKSTKKDHWLLKPYNKSPEFVDQDIPIKLIQHVFIVKACMKKFF